MEEIDHIPKPRTPSTGVKMISSVLNQRKISNAARADIAIEEWEDRMNRLNVEDDEEVSAEMRVAVLYAMLLKDLQKRVLDKRTVDRKEKRKQTKYTARSG